jgi:hypothetical protein
MTEDDNIRAEKMRRENCLMIKGKVIFWGDII